MVGKVGYVTVDLHAPMNHVKQRGISKIFWFYFMQHLLYQIHIWYIYIYIYTYLYIYIYSVCVYTRFWIGWHAVHKGESSHHSQSPIWETFVPFRERQFECAKDCGFWVRFVWVYFISKFWTFLHLKNFHLTKVYFQVEWLGPLRGVRKCSGAGQYFSIFFRSFRCWSLSQFARSQWVITI